MWLRCTGACSRICVGVCWRIQRHASHNREQPGKDRIGFKHCSSVHSSVYSVSSSDGLSHSSVLMEEVEVDMALLKSLGNEKDDSNRRLKGEWFCSRSRQVIPVKKGARGGLPYVESHLPRDVVCCRRFTR